MQIQIRDLYIFMKVAENRSFTKASELLFIAQPSLSKSVQKLEKELDVILFDRSNRRLNLTEAGAIVYEKGKIILSTLEDISTSIDELSELVTGTLKIGLSPIIGSLFYPKIAQVYTKKFPKVTIETIEEGTIVIGKQVERGLLDVGFVVLPVKNDTLKSIPIYKDEFVLCVSKNHPLASAQTVSFAHLKEEDFILFPENWALYALVVDACKNAGFIPKIAFKSAQWDLILELVSAEIGITIIPKILAKKLNDIDIVSIPITNPSVVWNIGIITSANSYHSYALKEFVKIIKQTYQ